MNEAKVTVHQVAVLMMTKEEVEAERVAWQEYLRALPDGRITVLGTPLEKIWDGKALIQFPDGRIREIDFREKFAK